MILATFLSGLELCGSHEKFRCCGCLDSPHLSDSDEEMRNTAEGRAARMEMQEILDTFSFTLRRQQERQAESLDTNRMLQSALATAAAAMARFPGRSPPPSYITPPPTQVGTNALTAPENASGEATESESERAAVMPGPMGPISRIAYSRNPHRFMFTTVPTPPQSAENPENPFRESSGLS